MLIEWTKEFLWFILLSHFTLQPNSHSHAKLYMFLHSTNRKICFKHDCSWRNESRSWKGSLVVKKLPRLRHINSIPFSQASTAMMLYTSYLVCIQPYLFTRPLKMFVWWSFSLSVHYPLFRRQKLLLLHIFVSRLFCFPFQF